MSATRSVVHYTWAELLAAHDALVAQVVDRDATIVRLQKSHTAAWNQSVRDGETIVALRAQIDERPTPCGRQECPYPQVMPQAGAKGE